ncbi:MAG: hypothetical protein Q9174_003337 [Haloplaca sp. 1 TL-2023]
MVRLVQNASRPSSPPFWNETSTDSFAADSYAERLAEACKSGDLDLTHRLYSTWLKQQQPDPKTGYIVDRHIHRAARAAAEHQHSTCLAYIIQRGQKIDSEIAGAAYNSDTRCLQVLLDHGWDINTPQGYATPPLLCFALKDENLLRWFLDHGAKPNVQAEDRYNVMPWKHGVKRDITPLSFAVRTASLDTIKVLFDYGGSAAYGQLLNMASHRTDPECIPIMQYIYDKGDTRINATYLEDQQTTDKYRGFDNATPLHHAARLGNIDAVRWLLNHGANPTIRTKRVIGYGTTALDSATTKNHTEIAALLRQSIDELPQELRRDLPQWPTGTDFLSKYNRKIISPSTWGPRTDINHGNYAEPSGMNSHHEHGPNHAVQDYSFFLMILEMMNKERIKRTRERAQASGITADEMSEESEESDSDWVDEWLHKKMRN